MGEEHPLISAVVLTRNRRHSLERCLRSLSAQGYPQLEVVVVDNGSTDGTREWLSEQEIIERLVIVEGEPEASFAEVRNLGVDAAAGSLIAFLDDDCEAQPGWLARIAANLAEVDAVGGATAPPADLVFPRWWDERMGWAVGLHGPEHRNPRTAGSLAYPDTSNMAVCRPVLRREPFQSVGGYLDGSAAVYRWGREDAELWRRLRLRGYRTRFDPEQRVTHHIDPGRLCWSYLKGRARQDGQSAWHRTREMALVRLALGDLMAGPGQALRSLLSLRRWRVHALWRVRQRALVRACVRDRGHGAVLRLRMGALKRWLLGSLKRLGRVPLWFLLTQLRSPLRLRRRVPEHPEHICIACQGFIGDTVLLGSLLEGLRRARPDGRITLVANRHARELQGRSPHIDALVEISPPRFLFGWERWKEIRRVLRRLAPDVVLVPYWHDAPAWPLLISHRAPVIGFGEDMGFRRQLWHDLLDLRVAKDFERHEVENLFALGRCLGVEGEPSTVYELPPLAPPSDHFDALMSEHGLQGVPLIALHIGATGVGKHWPESRWIALAQRLRAAHPDHRLVFVGDSRQRPSVHRLLGESPLEGAVNACANRPLGDVAALLRRSRLLITTDSGPKHLAMALGVPTVALYGHSSERRWGAWSGQIHHRAVISPGWDLRPEELGDLGPEHRMALITVDEVEAAVESLLGRNA
ncbi:glycosyltransferase [Candidatus Sumerlaeota bacterium]|nr:glycosyltransferase [Candidatus Sumerlaeota bacterium]